MAGSWPSGLAQVCGRTRDTLGAMGQAAIAEQSFAGVLATVVKPAAGESAGRLADSLFEDGLLDDVVVFSREGALKNLARSTDASPRTTAEMDAPVRSGTGASRKPPQAERDADWRQGRAMSGHSSRNPAESSLSITEVDVPRETKAPRELKRASITIRLSRPECARLKARAAESGMTISEYLRSCTLEVENLRTQVKDAVATMRAQAAPENPHNAPVERPSLLGRMAQIWPRGRGELRVER